MCPVSVPVSERHEFDHSLARSGQSGDVAALHADPCVARRRAKRRWFMVEAVHPWCVTGVEDPAGTWATLPVRHWRRRRDAASPGVVPLPLIGWRGLRSRSE